MNYEEMIRARAERNGWKVVRENDGLLVSDARAARPGTGSVARPRRCSASEWRMAPNRSRKVGGCANRQ